MSRRAEEPGGWLHEGLYEGIVVLRSGELLAGLVQISPRGALFAVSPIRRGDWADIGAPGAWPRAVAGGHRPWRIFALSEAVEVRIARPPLELPFGGVVDEAHHFEWRHP